MDIIAKVGAALQQLFGPCAEKAALETGVIRRKRKFTAISLAKSFVLGFLQDPRASDEDLAQMAAQCGVDVTAQAIEQRHSPAMVQFLERLFREATKLVVGSGRSLAPILERFRNVTMLDSSTTQLPDSMRAQFPGCGGRSGFGQAALKLQTELDLRSGALEHVEIEPGRRSDGGTIRQWARRGQGSLRITDLGYFNVTVFADMVAHGEHFLSRLQFGTGVLLPDGQELALLAWLEHQAGPFSDQPILLGKNQRLACRLIAWRVPEEQANRRRQKLRQEVLRKSGQEPSAERLAWCDWTILVTSVPAEMLTAEEALVLYRARWQIELLFKRWKAQGLVAELSGSSDVRKMIRVWSRLLAALVQHWLAVTSAWGDPRKSLVKVSKAVRAFANRIASALFQPSALEQVLIAFCQVISKTCRRNRRAKTGTFELLNDVSLLDYRLT
jgi:hypothetical protein